VEAEGAEGVGRLAVGGPGARSVHWHPVFSGSNNFSAVFFSRIHKSEEEGGHNLRHDDQDADGGGHQELELVFTVDTLTQFHIGHFTATKTGGSFWRFFPAKKLFFSFYCISSDIFFRAQVSLESDGRPLLLLLLRLLLPPPPLLNILNKDSSIAPLLRLCHFLLYTSRSLLPSL
jgi:hypothetical protein